MNLARPNKTQGGGLTLILSTPSTPIETPDEELATTNLEDDYPSSE